MAASDRGRHGNPATTTTAWTASVPVCVAPGHVTARGLDVAAQTVRVQPSRCPTAPGREENVPDFYFNDDDETITSSKDRYQPVVSSSSPLKQS